MTCKPTAGEMRECGDGTRAKVRKLACGIWFSDFKAHPFCTSRIVEVAPKNRARVTAGPAWMGAR